MAGPARRRRSGQRTDVRRLRGLTELGARVAVLRADVTDHAQVSRAAGQLRDRFGPISGVIHAAGLPSRGLIAAKTPDDVAEVLAAKTHGTLVLDEICGAEAASSCCARR